MHAYAYGWDRQTGQADGLGGQMMRIRADADTSVVRTMQWRRLNLDGEFKDEER